MSPSQRNNLADDLRSFRVMSADQYIADRARKKTPLEPWRARVLRSMRWGRRKPCRAAWSMLDLALDAVEIGARERAKARAAGGRS